MARRWGGCLREAEQPHARPQPGRMRRSGQPPIAPQRRAPAPNTARPPNTHSLHSAAHRGAVQALWLQMTREEPSPLCTACVRGVRRQLPARAAAGQGRLPEGWRRLPVPAKAPRARCHDLLVCAVVRTFPPWAALLETLASCMPACAAASRVKLTHHSAGQPPFVPAAAESRRRCDRQ